MNKKTKGKQESISAAEATKILRRQQEIESRQCHQEIQQVLQKWGRQLIGVPVYIPDGVGGWRTRVDFQLIIPQQQ